MKVKLLGTSWLLALLLVCSCGKKPQEYNGDQVMGPTQSEITFNALVELHSSVEENDIEGIKKVVRKHPNIDLDLLCSSHQETLLVEAIRKGSREIRNYLLEKGVDLERPTHEGKTPLMVAAEMGDLNTVKVLIDLNVNLNKSGKAGNTALHLAVRNAHEEVALLLIKQGANVEITNNENKTAYRLAQDVNAAKVIELIKNIMQVEYGTPELQNFRSVITLGDVKSLELMLSRFPRIIKDYEFINPLALAVEIEDATVSFQSTDLLLYYGANVNGPKDAETTPLIRSVMLKKRGHVNQLLRLRADPNLVDSEGLSALAHAIMVNDQRIVNMLLAKNALVKYKYTTKDNKRESVDVCELVKEVGKELEDHEEKEINKAIKKSLDCSWWRWWLF